MNEQKLTEMVFNSLSNELFEMDFGDEGNTIFVTPKKKPDKHFTILIEEDYFK